MRNLGIKAFFLIWRKNTLNVDLGGGGKHIYICVYMINWLVVSGSSAILAFAAKISSAILVGSRGHSLSNLRG